MCLVSVKVRFVGAVSRRTGISEITLSVKSDIDKAAESVKNEIVARAGNDVLFNMFINGVNYSLARKSETKVKDGDEFYVVPVIIGG